MFHGPEEGQGITVYSNGAPLTSTSLRITSYLYNASGIVVIGKQHVDRSKFYATVMADELTFWNRQLTDEEVVAIRDVYLS